MSAAEGAALYAPPGQLSRQDVFDAPFRVITGPGAVIRHLMFGPPPTSRHRLERRLRATMTVAARIRAIEAVLPGADPGGRNAARLEAECREMREALKGAVG